MLELILVVLVFSWLKLDKLLVIFGLLPHMN